MRKLLATLIAFSLVFAAPAEAAKQYAKRYPNDTALQVLPATGSYTSGNCLETDANGNVVDAGAPCGSGSGGSAPGGSGSNIQYRVDATTFGGVTGSSVSGSQVTLGAVSATDATFSVVDVNGGTIDATQIGKSSATDATFTAVNIDGGVIDGTRIGPASAADATFTNVEVLNTTGDAGFFATSTQNTAYSYNSFVTNGDDWDAYAGGSSSGDPNSYVIWNATDNQYRVQLDGAANGNNTFTPNGTGSNVLGKVQITAGTINGTTIGASSPADATFNAATVTDAAYASTWNGSNLVPTRNAVYDKIESLAFAPTNADYLVGTADGTLSNEIVVGTTPGGELGGTWPSPTIDDGVTVSGWTLDASQIGKTSATDATFSALSLTASSSAGQLVRSTGSGAPVGFTTATYPTTAASSGSILRANGTNYLATSATYPNSVSTTQGRLIVSAPSGDAIQVSGTNLTYDGTTISATSGSFSGGTINGMTIGATSPSTATFTALTVNGTPVVFPVTTSLGGTGSAGGFALNAPIFAGTTTTSAFQSGSLGSAGHVLTSNGNGSIPTFQAIAAGGGTITQIGDVTAGAAFEGTSGTALTFNDATTDGTVNYSLANGFRFSQPINATNIGTSSPGDATFSAINVPGTGSNSLELGPGAFAEDANSIAVGANPFAQADSIAIGDGALALNSGGSRSLAIGQGASATDLSTCIGNGCLAIGSDLVFGEQAYSNAGFSIVGGQGTGSDGFQSVVMGWLSYNAGTRGIIIGKQTTINSGSTPAIVVGSDGTVSGGADRVTLIGPNLSSAFNDTVLIGGGASSTADRQFVVGGSGTNGYTIDTMYLGEGITSTTATSPSGTTVITATGGSGSNNAARGLVLRGGTPTGNSTTGGYVSFETPDVGSSSSTPQAQVERLRIVQGGNIGVGTTTPTYKFDVTGSIRATTSVNSPIVATAGAAITGGTINGTTIGASSAADATFATIMPTVNYKSSDGTAGMTGSCGPAITSITIKNGLITACT